MEIRDSLRQWKERHVLFYALIWLVCILFVLLRGSVAHLIRAEWLYIDLVPIFLIYLIAKEQNLKALYIAFVVGLLTDIFSSCHLGLCAFAYSAILLGINSCRQFLDFTNIKTSVVLVAVFVLAKWFLVLIVMSAFPSGQTLPSINAVLVVFSALLTGLITPVLFYVLDLALKGDNSNYG
jgi:rod shape-determining protein MreD